MARVPYFSFLSVLHLYETLGFWRRADYLKVHFAQTMNEFHHLLIMESLGGDRKFIDRFFAQHLALGYYGIACLMYMAGGAPFTAVFTRCASPHRPSLKHRRPTEQPKQPSVRVLHRHASFISPALYPGALHAATSLRFVDANIWFCA